ncbi:MAG: hypothetical protein R3Y67_05080 [Eubacteriales bacterium]
MNLLKALFRRKQEEQIEYELEEIPEELEPIEALEEKVDTDSPEDRDRFVMDCLESMNESITEVERLNAEYGDVTLHLTDIEELDRLPQSERDLVEDCAQKIVVLDEERTNIMGKKILLTKKQFQLMEHLENEMPKPYEKLKEAEEYQEKIKSDLSRLAGEKEAYAYRKEELQNFLYNTKGMAVTCMIAFVVCAVLLLLMQLALQIDVMIGYMIATIAVATTITMICVKHIEYKKEKRHVLAAYNKIVMLQNKVKIRYVNNTNLLEFLRVKYKCDTSKIMNTLWKRYQEELIEREQFERADEELEYEHIRLMKLLSRYPIEDKQIWISQAKALVDPREMVEIRHSYNTQRQKLRKQMQYNHDVAERKQEAIKALVAQYPDSASEILAIVSRYEERAEANTFC